MFPHNPISARPPARVIFTKFLTKLFFPSFCINCKKETPEEPPSLRWLCFDCHRTLNPRWERTALRPEIEEAFFLFDYQRDKLAQKLIRALKYDLVKEIADSLNVALEKQRLNISRLADGRRIDFVMPVPLHRRRLKERGFNQSSLIANKISELTHKEVREDILVRKNLRRHQAQIKKRAEREKNIQNIFSCLRPDLVIGKMIMIVDDVATTGATLKECARVLKTAGAAKIFTFTLARD